MDGQSYAFVANAARTYWVHGQSVLECGSRDVNGTIRDLLPNANYLGIDMLDGPNVHMVCNTHDIPYESNRFDWVISLSHLEHDSAPWLSAEEMYRVCKPGGLILVTVPGFPSAIHEYPEDLWRVSPKALVYLFEDAEVIASESVYDGEWATSCLLGRK